MWNDKKNSVMWNRVRVKYDSVWPTPTPNIRCLFFVHHIHSPLPTTTTPRHPRLWLVILLPYYDYYYYYYPTSSPTITTTNTPRHLPVPLIYSSSPSSMTRHPPLPQLQHRNPISYSSSSPSTTSPAVQYLYILHLQPTLLLPHTYYHNYDCSFDNYSSSPSSMTRHLPLLLHQRAPQLRLLLRQLLLVTLNFTPSSSHSETQKTVKHRRQKKKSPWVKTSYVIQSSRL